MLPRWSILLGYALLLGGCHCAIQEQVDQSLCQLAGLSVDPLPPGSELPDPAATDTSPQPRTTRERLRVPPALPGAEAPPISVPAPDPEQPKKRTEALNQLYPDLPGLGTAAAPACDQPLTLTELQQLALANSPLLRQAAAEVAAAKGDAIQAGLYPNPTTGYEVDQFNQGGTAGMQGAFVEQTIVTGGKLKLAQAAATVSVFNAELKLKRVQADLAAQVRAGYFAVLVAQENVRVSQALAEFTNEIYSVQVEQVKGGQAAPYEPLQLRVLAVQARADLLRARNRHTAAWKELAATLGLPGMPLGELAGRVDMPIPAYSYDTALNWVLVHHTDVQTANNDVQRARYQLKLEQVTPLPNVDCRYMLQKDFTTPPFLLVSSVVVGMKMPVWDKNQGNIMAAQAALLRATEEAHRVRNDLTARLADAFERYNNNRELLRYYRDQILPDQVRTYRGAYQRYQVEPAKVGFGELVVAQQTLGTAVAAYVQILGDLWLSVADISRLLQTNDLFRLGPDSPPTECVGPLPVLPCCHGSNPLTGADGTWPPALPEDGLPATPRPASGSDAPKKSGS